MTIVMISEPVRRKDVILEKVEHAHLKKFSNN